MKDFAVFVGLDKNYLDALYIFLNSYIRNSCISHLDFYIFSNDLTEEDIKIDFDFTLIKVDRKKYTKKCIDNVRTEDFGLSAPLRLDGFDYLKTRYKYGMYFDSDMIINDDLSGLIQEFDEDLQAVSDCVYYDSHKEAYSDAHNEVLRYKEYECIFSGKYFNSGFMLINFANVMDFDFADNYKNSTEVYYYYDQDFLNAYYDKKNVKLLPAIYNAKPEIPHILSGTTLLLIEQRVRMRNSKIVHFTGVKPWTDSRNSMYSVSNVVQWPLDVFYREYEYVKDIVSDACVKNVIEMENTILLDIVDLEERSLEYQRRISGG